MRAYEDFRVGEVMTFGPIAVTAEDIKSVAARFDPQPMHVRQIGVPPGDRFHGL